MRRRAPAAPTRDLPPCGGDARQGRGGLSRRPCRTTASTTSRRSASRRRRVRIFDSLKNPPCLLCYLKSTFVKRKARHSDAEDSCASRPRPRGQEENENADAAGQD